MIPLGLHPAELRTFHNALADHHSIKINAAVMNLDGDTLTHLDVDVLDGQVNVDTTAAVDRSLELDILDRNRTLHFDSDSPSDGALYMDRMLRIHYSVRADDTIGWVDVPLFTGPISSLNRKDDIVHIAAQGKEALALGQSWIPQTYKKGHLKVDVIRKILQATGETRFDLPDLTARLHKPLSLGRTSVPWLACQRLARSMNRQLFYDGRGTCRLRPQPGRVFTFKTGVGGNITVYPEVTYTTDGLFNVVWVKGGKPRGVKDGTDEAKKTPDIQAHLIAPHSHPLSPWKLGRNGQPRFLVDVVENSKIRSKREALRVANQRLHNHLLEAVQVQLEGFPAPHLDPLDLIGVNTDEGVFSMLLRQFSIPLSTSASMTIGFNRRLTANRRRVR